MVGVPQAKLRLMPTSQCQSKVSSSKRDAWYFTLRSATRRGPSCFECRRGAGNAQAIEARRLKFVEVLPRQRHCVKQHLREPRYLTRSRFPAQQIAEDKNPTAELSDKPAVRKGCNGSGSSAAKLSSGVWTIAALCHRLYPTCSNRRLTVQSSFLGKLALALPRYLDRNDAMDLASHSLAFSILRPDRRSRSPL